MKERIKSLDGLKGIACLLIAKRLETICNFVQRR